MAGDNGMTKKYWSEGTAIVEAARNKAIAQAKSEEWYSWAPMGMSPEQARGYHAGKIDAYQHALEMMGYFPNG